MTFLTLVLLFPQLLHGLKHRTLAGLIFVSRGLVMENLRFLVDNLAESRGSQLLSPQVLTIKGTANETVAEATLPATGLRMPAKRPLESTVRVGFEQFSSSNTLS